VATLKIDDREAPKTEPQRARNVVTFVVRTAVNETLRHLLNVLSEHWSLAFEVVLPANPAHKIG
jgi:hypothetical protein